VEREYIPPIEGIDARPWWEMWHWMIFSQRHPFIPGVLGIVEREYIPPIEGIDAHPWWEMWHWMIFSFIALAWLAWMKNKALLPSTWPRRVW
jgi:hypothetical protein